MLRIGLTRQLSQAASFDAANSSMRSAGRSTWNADDAQVADEEFQHIWPRCEHGIEPEELCFYGDQDIIPAGHPLSNRLAPSV